MLRFDKKSISNLRISKVIMTNPKNVLIPGDSSMVSFAILLAKLHQNQIKLHNWPDDKDCLGNEILKHNSDNLGIVWQDNEIRFCKR